MDNLTKYSGSGKGGGERGDARLHYAQNRLHFVNTHLCG
uniref:Uncharacterized protein n=1 Tax=Parascaris equorum TaxID=6256 RepID=A0A914RK46_PAREQ